MELGFTSWLSDTVALEDAIGILSQANCARIEVAGNPDYLPRAALIAKLLTSYGMQVSTISAGVPFYRDRSLNLHSADELTRGRSVEYVRRCVDFACTLGAPIVYVCSVECDRRNHDRSLSLLRTSLETCSDYAEKAGVRVAVEPFPTGELGSTRETGEFLKAMNRKNLGLLFDAGHLAISREPLAPTAREWKGILMHVHLNNNDGVSDLHWPPQRGVLTAEDFRTLLMELSSGYAGRISLELRSPTPTATELSQASEYLSRLVSGHPNR